MNQLLILLLIFLFISGLLVWAYLHDKQKNNEIEAELIEALGPGWDAVIGGMPLGKLPFLSAMPSESLGGFQQRPYLVRQGVPRVWLFGNTTLHVDLTTPYGDTVFVVFELDRDFGGGGRVEYIRSGHIKRGVDDERFTTLGRSGNWWLASCKEAGFDRQTVDGMLSIMVPGVIRVAQVHGPYLLVSGASIYNGISAFLATYNAACEYHDRWIEWITQVDDYPLLP